jgi:hypothetical protein
MPARPQRARRKPVQPPAAVAAGVVARSGGPSIGRAHDTGPVRRGGKSGIGFLVAVAVLGAAYLVIGSFRQDIVARFPAAYPALKAVGFEVSEPLGFGLALSGTVQRATDENGHWVVFIRGRVKNSLDRRADVPRILVRVRASNIAAPLAWTVEPALSSLAPGQTTDFTSRHTTPFALRDLHLSLGFTPR